MKEVNCQSAAANVAEEVVRSIRTVFAFGGEKVEIDRYNERLKTGRKYVQVKGYLLGIFDAIMRFLFYTNGALAFWFGIQFILDDRDKVDKEYTPANLLIVCCMSPISFPGDSNNDNVSNVYSTDILRYYSCFRQSRKNATIFGFICFRSRIRHYHIQNN